MNKLKSNSVISTQVEGEVLVINVLGHMPIRFDTSLLSERLNLAARMHGWKQRLCDTAAIGADPKASVQQRAAEKFEAIRELAEYYVTGDPDWKRVGTGGGDGGLLLTAICRLRPNKTVEECAQFLESRSPEQLKAVRANPQVIEMIARIRVERAPKLASGALDELDGELDGEELSE